MAWTWLILPSSLLSLAITVPLNGALVRYRAHYNPSRIQLGENGASNPSPVTGYFSVLKRVYRLEGCSGLYKGFSPTFVAFVFILSVLAAYLRFDFSTPRIPWRFDDLGILGSILFGLLSMVVGIPMQVLANRAIVTPYKLPYTNPLTCARILLSPTERRKPWNLYLLPGLFTAFVAQLFISIAVVPMIRILLLPFNGTFNPLSALAATGYFFFALACSAVQAPLQVVIVRLSIQRSHSDDNSSEAVEAEAYGVETYSDEEVITLKDEQEYYHGLQDCLNTIIAEEGWRTLFRAWWLTALGMYLL
uniref:Mitochondrial carrier n=1 Tax=Moniliophthora roreri TaxID=221103 RepID=A0A0W0G615_MONRR